MKRRPERSLSRRAVVTAMKLLRDWETAAVSVLRFTHMAFGFGRDIIGDGSVIPEMVIALEDVPEFDHGLAQSPAQFGGKTPFTVAEGRILSERVVMRRVRPLAARG